MESKLILSMWYLCRNPYHGRVSPRKFLCTFKFWASIICGRETPYGMTIHTPTPIISIGWTIPTSIGKKKKKTTKECQNHPKFLSNKRGSRVWKTYSCNFCIIMNKHNNIMNKEVLQMLQNHFASIINKEV